MFHLLHPWSNPLSQIRRLFRVRRGPSSLECYSVPLGYSPQAFSVACTSCTHLLPLGAYLVCCVGNGRSPASWSGHHSRLWPGRWLSRQTVPPLCFVKLEGCLFRSNEPHGGEVALYHTRTRADISQLYAYH